MHIVAKGQAVLNNHAICPLIPSRGFRIYPKRCGQHTIGINRCSITFAPMLLADKKKESNIAEYIIYMYQAEQLIRNFAFDIDKIKVHVFGNIADEKMSTEEKDKNLAWYNSVLKEMQKEGLEKEGHLSYVQDEVEKLSALSIELLGTNTDYQTIFNAARPAIRENLQASQGLITNPIQVCLNGVFGLLLARMNGKEIPEAIQQQLAHFGNVLSFLSAESRD